jgi:hypothetical protein
MGVDELYFDSPRNVVYDNVDDIRKYNSYSIDGFIYKYYGIPTRQLILATDLIRGGTDKDVNTCFYRLSDAYLALAEAQAEQKNFEGAKKTLEKLREARNIEDDITLPENLEAYQDFILEERRREFLGEGKEWFDLLRICKRNDFARKEKLIETVLKNVGASTYQMMKSKLKDTNSYYMPVHIDELRHNAKLKQNPYYEDVTKI